MAQYHQIVIVCFILLGIHFLTWSLSKEKPQWIQKYRFHQYFFTSTNDNGTIDYNYNIHASNASTHPNTTYDPNLSNKTSSPLNASSDPTPAAQPNALTFNESMSAKLHAADTRKQIMVWNYAPWKFLRGNTIFKHYNCRFQECYVFKDSSMRSFLDSDLAIVIGRHAYYHLDKLREYLPHRTNHTRFMWAIREPPLLSSKGTQAKEFNHLFQWTFSHRTESEFYFPYGLILPKDPATLSHWRLPVRNTSQWLPFDPTTPSARRVQRSRAKKNDILWIVSNCRPPSLRHVFIRKLRSVTSLKIDVYGKCNNMRIPKTEDMTSKYRSYKFYLSFENTLCKDYVSEKFFKVLTHAIPVVRGATIGEYSRIAPPHSYIHVHNFGTLRQLAAYLEYLARNETAYNEYFWWQQHYRHVDLQAVHRLDRPGPADDELPERLNPFCRLCRALHGNLSVSSGKSEQQLSRKYDYFHKFWRVDAKCARGMADLAWMSGT